MLNKGYEKLFLKLEEDGYKEATGKLKVAFSTQRNNMDNLIKIVVNVATDYTLKDDKVVLTASQKRRLRASINKRINNMLRNEIKVEWEHMKSILPEITSEKYYKDAYVMGAGINFGFKYLNDKVVKEIVNDTVDGLTWSSRIWTNKVKMEKEIKKEIKNFLLGNTNISSIKKQIRQRYKSNAYNTKRLLDTEVARCQSNINEEFNLSHGIEQVMYSAVLDKHTCHICALDDGRIFNVNDSSKPQLPRHPMDRCCYIGIPFRGWEPTVRLDNDSKKYIPYMSYGEWKKTIITGQ